MLRSLQVLVAALAVTTPGVAQSPPNACGLVPEADVVRLIVRGKPTYNATPEAFVVAQGRASVCEYPTGGQVSIFVGPNSAALHEDHLKGFKIVGGPRQAVSGIGDKAFLFYTRPQNDREYAGPYLVMTVGQYTMTAWLQAWKGQADGAMSAYCRDSANVKKNDKKSCREIMADKSEVPESLEPAARELGKILVDKVRTGKF